MDDYQKEQFDAYSMIMSHLVSMPEGFIRQLEKKIEGYVQFRMAVNDFLSAHFSDICNQNCFQNRKSACCSKEGIVTFFADTVINVIRSEKKDIEGLLAVLKTENTGFKCIYLGETGCMWKLKPIVCEMFLCQKAKAEVFENNTQLAEEWDHIKKTEKDFTWPDKPVLFDDLEDMFIKAGLKSPLMYFHNSPGLLRIKKTAIKSRKDSPSN